MNRKWLSILIFPLLFAACSSGNIGEENIKQYVAADSDALLEAEKYYAFFMYNYPRVTLKSPNGYDELVDNMLYVRQEIEPNQPFNKPELDPTREKYEFQGWFKEKECQVAWDFDNDTSATTLYLYAKWGVTEEEVFVEPEYVYPETIIDDQNYILMGILNRPISSNKVQLTKGGINRLIEHKDDVRFALNYKRKATVEVTIATFDESSNTIHVEVSSGESFNVLVEDITATLAVPEYETKASKYEEESKEVENYHIALAGSSSMENWKTSTEDMDPIVTFNHGIGGTTAEQWVNSLMERLIAPYSPKAVVYYVGVNDIINKSKTGEATAENLEALFDKTHEYLPNTQIFYVMINKLPGFANKQAQFDIANEAAKKYAKANDYLICIDAGKDLVKENGLPSAAYFLTDGLHMSKYGYTIWGKAVKDAVINWLLK